MTLYPGDGEASAERVRVLQCDGILQAPSSGFLRKAGNSARVSLSVCLSTRHLQRVQTKHTFWIDLPLLSPTAGREGVGWCAGHWGFGAVFLDSCWECVKFPSLGVSAFGSVSGGRQAGAPVHADTGRASCCSL